MVNPVINPITLALITLSAQVAAQHPGHGKCQLDRLKTLGVAQEDVETVLEIARHIREEVTTRFDEALDAVLLATLTSATPQRAEAVSVTAECCGTSNRCC
ncbi:hypothetical protein [Acidithiobacillus sp.]|uniref:hypothetical protein n=1 Tax=Acidithiobacillus sp. TaxID=1872118 RepID=UPI0025B7C042|nr:hypothetical protein [Acidithiobacillus sp.]